MKNKILKILITGFALSTLAFTLTACTHEHSYTPEVINPTCTEQGYTRYTCDCGDTYVDDYVDETGHSFTDYVYNSNAKCETNGTETAVCDNGCEKTDTRTAYNTKLEHVFTNYLSNDDSTIENDGTKTAICDREGCTKKDTVADVGSMLIPSQGLTYSLNLGEQSYSVTGLGTCNDTILVIPSTYENLPVTNISSDAFNGITSLTKAVIPNGVTTIGDRAFNNCSLTRIIIPDSVTDVGENAFLGCDSLEKTIYLGTVDSWAQINFNNKESNPIKHSKNLYVNYELLENANITNAITIKPFAFYCCYTLKTLTIGDSVEIIGNRSFTYCYSLTNVTISNSVTILDECAFYDCKVLTNVALGNSVTTIGTQAFNYCVSLTTINLPNSVTSIGDNAFYNCKALKKITIPSSVETIGKKAFEKCSSLTNITFSDTESWYRVKDYDKWQNKDGGISVITTSSYDNATNFTTTYYNYYWYKLKESN